MNISASEFVKMYCENSGITEREFYETQIPMPDPTSPFGWAAVSNNPLLIKAHVDLYASSQPAPDMNEDNLRVQGINMAMSLITSKPAEPEFADGIHLCLKCMCAVKTLLLEKYIPEPVLVNTDWESCRERANRTEAARDIAKSLISVAKRTAGLLRQLDYAPSAKSKNPIEVLLFDAEKVVNDIKEIRSARQSASDSGEA